MAVHGYDPSKEHTYRAQLLAYVAPSLMLHVLTDEKCEQKATRGVLENRIAETCSWPKSVDDYVTDCDPHAWITHICKDRLGYPEKIRI